MRQPQGSRGQEGYASHWHTAIKASFLCWPSPFAASNKNKHALSLRCLAKSNYCAAQAVGLYLDMLEIQWHTPSRMIHACHAAILTKHVNSCKHQIRLDLSIVNCWPEIQNDRKAWCKLGRWCKLSINFVVKLIIVFRLFTGAVSVVLHSL